MGVLLNIGSINVEKPRELFIQGMCVSVSFILGLVSKIEEERWEGRAHNGMS